MPRRGIHVVGQASFLPSNTAELPELEARLLLEHRRMKHSPSECFYQRLEVLPVAAGHRAFLLQLLKPLLQVPALLFLLSVLVQQETDRVLPGRKLFF